jgi:hypothetical protein
MLIAHLTAREDKRIFLLCQYFATVKELWENESCHVGRNEMAGLNGKSGPPGNMNAFKYGLAAIQKRREESVTTEHEEGVRQQILGGLIADKGGRSFFCSPNQYSIVKFFPSIHSSSRSSCRNASTRAALPEAVLASRNPIRGRPTPHRRACRPYGFSPSSTVPHCHPVRASAGPPGSRAWSFHTCLGSLTPRCRRTARA